MRSTLRVKSLCCNGSAYVGGISGGQKVLHGHECGSGGHKFQLPPCHRQKSEWAAHELHTVLKWFYTSNQCCTESRTLVEGRLAFSRRLNDAKSMEVKDFPDR